MLPMHTDPKRNELGPFRGHRLTRREVAVSTLAVWTDGTKHCDHFYFQYIGARFVSIMWKKHLRWSRYLAFCADNQQRFDWKFRWFNFCNQSVAISVVIGATQQPEGKECVFVVQLDRIEQMQKDERVSTDVSFMVMFLVVHKAHALKLHISPHFWNLESNIIAS